MSMTVSDVISRGDFVEAIGRAVRHGGGYAAGKLGVSERAWLHYPLFLEGGPGRIQQRAMEQVLRVKATRQSGVFPPEPGFYRRFAEFHAGCTRRLDCVGVAQNALAQTRALLEFHDIGGALIDYVEQEPDRSTPAADERCYLPHFAGARLLLVSPFAELLCGRATAETFEAVWARTGKRWFHPASVEAVEFPYGFEPETHERYGTCLDLLDEVASNMAAHEYDVALIGAGALGIPLAASARDSGKVAISLGGHLQVLFGVLGERWRNDREWRERYINDAWVDMPARYRPDPLHVDPGADYW